MIQKGSIVKMHYTLTVEGQVADTSAGGEPLEFEQGVGMIIVGLEEQLVGKKAGDKFQTTIPPEKAYGFHNPQAVQAVPREAFGEQAKEFAPGGVISGEMQGQPFQAYIVSLDDKEVTLDLNHPLSGKTLHFDVEVVSVNTPSKLIL